MAVATEWLEYSVRYGYGGVDRSAVKGQVLANV